MSTAQKVTRLLAIKLVVICSLGLALAPEVAMAADPKTIGGLADQISGSFQGIINLIIGGCYVAGLALSGAAILKFKAHKDNPTQVPLGTPIALLFIGAALLWLPSLVKSTGQTVFGEESSSAGTLSGWNEFKSSTGE